MRTTSIQLVIGLLLCISLVPAVGLAETAAPTTVTATEVKEPTATGQTDQAGGQTATVATKAGEEAAPSGEAPMLAVAPRLGLTVPTSKLGPFVVLGLAVTGYLPVLEQQLGIALDLAWSRPSSEQKVNDSRISGAQTVEIKTQQLKLGIDVQYRIFKHGETLVPYVGLGPMLVLVGTTEDARFIPKPQKEQSTQFGVEVFGGADYRLGPGALCGELRLSWASLDQRLTGDSNSGRVDITAGYRLSF